MNVSSRVQPTLITMFNNLDMSSNSTVTTQDVSIQIKHCNVTTNMINQLLTELIWKNFNNYSESMSLLKIYIILYYIIMIYYPLIHFYDFLIFFRVRGSPSPPPPPWPSPAGATTFPPVLQGALPSPRSIDFLQMYCWLLIGIIHGQISRSEVKK